MYENIRLELIDDYTWVELSYVNGELGTYVLKKESEPNNFITAEYRTGDKFDELYELFRRSSEDTEADRESSTGVIDDSAESR